MTAHEALSALRDRGEDERIEAKTASSIGKSIMESICAFANEPGLGGGHLLLGIAPPSELADPPRYSVVGVQDAEAKSDELATRCANEFNHPLRPRIATILMEGRTVLHVFMPEAAASLKPIYFESRGLPSGALRRIGSTDQHSTEDDLQLFYDGRSHRTYDASVVEQATIEDLSPDAMESYRRLRAEIVPDADELSLSDIDFLLALRALDRAGDQPRPTVGGLLLFGSPLALRRFFPMTRIDYIRVPGREWVPDPGERFESIEIRGPLIQTVRRAEAAVIDDLPKAFQLSEGNLQRQEALPLPRRVMREAIVNAVIHRDYRTQSAVQIIRYSNRIEILNPGFSLKAPERLGEPGSATRNPVLAAAFYDTGLAETKGTGIRAMRQLMEQADLMPPTFESSRGENRFVSRFLLHHFLSNHDLVWLASQGLADRSSAEKLVAVFAREVGAVDNEKCRELTNKDTLGASHILRRLCELGVLEKKGRSTATYYVPVADGDTNVGERKRASLGAPSTPSKEMESGSAGQKPAMVDPKPTMEDEKPTMVDENPAVVDAQPAVVAGGQPNSDESVPGKPRGSDSGVAELRQAMPHEIRETIAGLGRRAGSTEMRDCIVRLCAWQPLTAAQIAGLLDRSLGYVKQQYLRPLMQDGLIEYTIPEMPKHPRQKYQAVHSARDER